MHVGTLVTTTAGTSRSGGVCSTIRFRTLAGEPGTMGCGIGKTAFGLFFSCVFSRSSMALDGFLVSSFPISLSFCYWRIKDGLVWGQVSPGLQKRQWNSLNRTGVLASSAHGGSDLANLCLKILRCVVLFSLNSKQ